MSHNEYPGDRDRGTKHSLRAPAPYSAEVSDKLEALLGLDPRETLDKLRDAQNATRVLREDLARQKARLASYEARYGFPSHWEHERKALLARLSSGERDRLLQLGKKPSEGSLSDYAHAHIEYRSFLEAGILDRREMERLRARVAEIYEEIETAKGVEVYFEKMARLNESLVYHSGREMGL